MNQDTIVQEEQTIQHVLKEHIVQQQKQHQHQHVRHVKMDITVQEKIIIQRVHLEK